MPLYFAYGSNLKVERLTERVGNVGVRGISQLADHRLSFDKRGKDGSGKACCVGAAGASVFGVLYSLSEAQLTELDRFERGYSREAIQVVGDARTPINALTYHAERRLDGLVPFTWYMRLMVEGAREHGLPAEWIARLEAIDAQEDPPQA
jgi:hypothetical protein